MTNTETDLKPETVWKTALTYANNICVQEVERINADDGSIEAMDAIIECQRRICADMDAFHEVNGINRATPDHGLDKAEALEALNEIDAFLDECEVACNFTYEKIKIIRQALSSPVVGNAVNDGGAE